MDKKFVQATLKKFTEEKIPLRKLTNEERQVILELAALDIPAIANVLEQQKLTNQQSNEQEK